MDAIAEIPVLTRISVDSASRHVATDIPIASERATGADVLAMLRSRRYSAADTVYVTDDVGRFVGAVAIAELLAAPASVSIGELADRTHPCVRDRDDQEHVATAALKHETISVAVVDARRRLLGVVPARALLAILREEHVEDLHRLAGIQREVSRDRDALEGPPARRARHRLPWLLFGLGGSMFAALLVSRFEHVLERDLAIAFFVPAIVYLADAIGTQTEAIAVRGLSISRLKLRHLVAYELRTGLVIGVTLAAIAFPIVALAFGNFRVGGAVAIAIIGAGSVATTIGLVLPWLLHRMGFDPAFGSGPVATIIQDVTSLMIYLALATWLV